MRSIRELCGADYTPEQINAWGGRPYSEDRRHLAMGRDYVWVLERLADEAILGFLHLEKALDTEGEHAQLAALYLVPEVAHQGWGRLLWMHAEETVRRLGLDRVRLDSTRTSAGFYARLGFRALGPEINHMFQGVAVPAIPMETRLGAGQRLRVAIYALVRSEGRLLVTKLADGPNQGRWNFPGGGLEWGESPLQALTREVREETSLALAPEQFRFREILSWQMDWKRPNGPQERLHTLALLYETEIAGCPEVKTDADGLSSLGATWIDPTTVDPERWAPQLRKVLGA